MIFTIITKRALKKKIWTVADARLDKLKAEIDSYADLIKVEMPEHFTEDMGCLDVLDRLVEISKSVILPNNVNSYLKHMKLLVARSEETIYMGNAILSALGLQN